jgi:hypothetical protein
LVIWRDDGGFGVCVNETEWVFTGEVEEVVVGCVCFFCDFVDYGFEDIEEHGFNVFFEVI